MAQRTKYWIDTRTKEICKSTGEVRHGNVGLYYPSDKSHDVTIESTFKKYFIKFTTKNIKTLKVLYGTVSNRR